MKIYDFKASYVANEINLNVIAEHFGITKKFKWEEPLILDERFLKGIIPQPEEKSVFIFHFGSIAYVNLTTHEIKDILAYIKKIDKMLQNNTPFSYVEEFKLEVNETKELEVNYNSIIVPTLNNYHLNIISSILSKSVAVKKIELDIDMLLDDIENIIEYLDKGKLNLSDEHMAKLSGKILRVKYNSLSYIMLLEKPDIAWKNEDAEQLFVILSELFELQDRYEKIKSKTEVLLNITEIFSTLTHSKRSTKLEWMVIILILMELVLSVFDAISKIFNL